MMPVASHTTIVDGLRFHERRAGAGRPIVFVHGLAVSSRYFQPTLMQLGRCYDCRAVDLPGFGHSDDPPEVLDVGGLADALASWMRVNGLHEAAVVGNSAGCQYVVDCVSRHRDLTGAVVLIGPTTDPTARTATGQIARWLRTAASADIGQLPVVVRDVRDAGVHRVATTFRAVLDDRIEDKLPGVTAPALVVRGSKDPLVPRRWAQQVTALLPRGRLVEVDGGAHIVHATKPMQVARHVHDFLSDPLGTPAEPRP